MSTFFNWLQTNWLEATMLFATVTAVVATIVAVQVAVLALRVARRSAKSADAAHERSVRLQARTILAEAQGSYQRLAAACDVNQAKWDRHRWKTGPIISANPFAPTKEMQELSSLKTEASEVLRTSVESLQSIDEMALSDLEQAIPKICHSASKIDALAQHIQEPGNALH